MQAVGSKWARHYFEPGKTFTVIDSVSFYAYPGTDSEKPDTPADSDDDNNKKLPEETVSNIVKTINEWESGSEPLKIEMGGAAVVPKEILEAAKGKDITLKLDMGGYTWTINGMDIASSNPRDINMQVILEKTD